MKALTLHQPWASLVAVGVKSIETRGWSTKYRGPLAIHAGAKPIGNGALYLGDGRRGWTNVTGEPIANGQQMMSGGIDDLLVCPLGVIVATCTLADVVPMVEWAADPQRNHLTIGQDGRLRSYEFVEGVLPLTWRKRDSFDVTDQRPYGDFTPGRYAWLLEDIKPTTERCPAGCEYVDDGYRRLTGEADVGGGRLGAWTWCATCDGTGRCDPIPAKGRQGLWEWTA